MEPQNGIAKKVITPIKIIYNNDEGILNYLADLKDRGLLKAIDTLNKEIKAEIRKSYCLLYRSVFDKLILVILYNAPFGFNEDDNKFMLYVHPSCRTLCIYFKNWLENEHTNNPAVQRGIDEITRLLYKAWLQYEDNENTPADFRG